MSTTSSGNSMFCYYGTGVGGGLTVAGVGIRGAPSNLGSIGHPVVDPDGPSWLYVFPP